MNNVPQEIESLRVFLAENPVHQPVVPKGPGLGLGNRMGGLESTSAMLAIGELRIEASAVQSSVFRELRPKFINPDGFFVEYKGIGSVPIGHTGMTIEEQFVESITDWVRNNIIAPFAADADHIPLKGDAGEEIEEFRKLAAEARDRTVFTIDPHFCVDHTAGSKEEKFRRVLPAYRRAADLIAEIKAGSPYVVELSIDESPGTTTPEEMAFLVGKIMNKNVPLFSIAPAIGFDKKDQDSSRMGRELRKLLPQLNQIAKDHGLILGIHSGDGKGRETRRIIGETTAGNVWYRIAPERQRMFYKLLSDSPDGSDERSLFEELFRRLHALSARADKPVAIYADTVADEVSRLKRTLEGPIFDETSDAVRALALLRDFGRGAAPTAERPEGPADPDRVAGVLAACRDEGRDPLIQEAMEMVSAYGIPVAEYRLVHDEEAAVAAAGELGYPVVLKVVSREVSHKSDFGGVQLNLRSDAGVRAAYAEMMASIADRAPGASIQGALVQPMLRGGRDLIVGARLDPNFGHVVLVGMGGVFVEVLRDRAMRVAPFGRRTAERMLEELKVYPILEGVRGQAAADIAALVETIRSVTRLVVDFPEIAELDLNPVRVLDAGDGCLALDARVVLAS